jgi:hypothetical protein
MMLGAGAMPDSVFDTITIRDEHPAPAPAQSGSPLPHLHCLFDGQVPLKRVHAATDRLETLLRRKGPELDPIVIHAEPFQA